MTSYSLRFVCFLLLSITTDLASSSGVLTIRLTGFKNPFGRTYDGTCCDPTPRDRGAMCSDECDYVMRLIVTGLGRANDHVFLFHRPLKYDSNNVVFEKDDNNVLLTVLFDQWPSDGQVKMNAFFYDYDDFDHTTTLVDWFETDLKQSKALRTDPADVWRQFQEQMVIGNRQSDKTILTFQWSALTHENSPFTTAFTSPEQPLDVGPTTFIRLSTPLETSSRLRHAWSEGRLGSLEELEELTDYYSYDYITEAPSNSLDNIHSKAEKSFSQINHRPYHEGDVVASEEDYRIHTGKSVHAGEIRRSGQGALPRTNSLEMNHKGTIDHVNPKTRLQSSLSFRGFRAPIKKHLRTKSGEIVGGGVSASSEDGDEQLYKSVFYKHRHDSAKINPWLERPNLPPRIQVSPFRARYLERQNTVNHPSDKQSDGKFLISQSLSRGLNRLDYQTREEISLNNDGYSDEINPNSHREYFERDKLSEYERLERLNQNTEYESSFGRHGNNKYKATGRPGLEVNYMKEMLGEDSDSSSTNIEIEEQQNPGISNKGGFPKPSVSKFRPKPSHHRASPFSKYRPIEMSEVVTSEEIIDIDSQHESLYSGSKDHRQLTDTRGTNRASANYAIQSFANDYVNEELKSTLSDLPHDSKQQNIGDLDFLSAPRKKPTSRLLAKANKVGNAGFKRGQPMVREQGFFRRTDKLRNNNNDDEPVTPVDVTGRWWSIFTKTPDNSLTPIWRTTVAPSIVGDSLPAGALQSVEKGGISSNTPLPFVLRSTRAASDQSDLVLPYSSAPESTSSQIHANPHIPQLTQSSSAEEDQMQTTPSLEMAAAQTQRAQDLSPVTGQNGHLGITGRWWSIFTESPNKTLVPKWKGRDEILLGTRTTSGKMLHTFNMGQGISSTVSPRTLLATTGRDVDNSVKQENIAVYISQSPVPNNENFKMTVVERDDGKRHPKPDTGNLFADDRELPDDKLREVYSRGPYTRPYKSDLINLSRKYLKQNLKPGVVNEVQSYAHQRAVQTTPRSESDTQYEVAKADTALRTEQKMNKTDTERRQALIKQDNQQSDEEFKLLADQKMKPAPKRRKLPSNGELIRDSIRSLKAVSYQTHAPGEWIVTAQPVLRKVSQNSNRTWSGAEPEIHVSLDRGEENITFSSGGGRPEDLVHLPSLNFKHIVSTEKKDAIDPFLDKPIDNIGRSRDVLGSNKNKLVNKLFETNKMLSSSTDTPNVKTGTGLLNSAMAVPDDKWHGRDKLLETDMDMSVETLPETSDTLNAEKDITLDKPLRANFGPNALTKNAAETGNKPRIDTFVAKLRDGNDRNVVRQTKFYSREKLDKKLLANDENMVVRENVREQNQFDLSKKSEDEATRGEKRETILSKEKQVHTGNVEKNFKTNNYVKDREGDILPAVFKENRKESKTKQQERQSYVTRESSSKHRPTLVPTTAPDPTGKENLPNTSNLLSVNDQKHSKTRSQYKPFDSDHDSHVLDRIYSEDASLKNDFYYHRERNDGGLQKDNVVLDGSETTHSEYDLKQAGKGLRINSKLRHIGQADKEITEFLNKSSDTVTNEKFDDRDSVKLEDTIGEPGRTDEQNQVQRQQLKSHEGLQTKSPLEHQKVPQIERRYSNEKSQEERHSTRVQISSRERDLISKVMITTKLRPNDQEEEQTTNAYNASDHVTMSNVFSTLSDSTSYSDFVTSRPDNPLQNIERMKLSLSRDIDDLVKVLNPDGAEKDFTTRKTPNEPTTSNIPVMSTDMNHSPRHSTKSGELDGHELSGGRESFKTFEQKQNSEALTSTADKERGDNAGNSMKNKNIAADVDNVQQTSSGLPSDKTFDQNREDGGDSNSNIRHKSSATNQNFSSPSSHKSGQFDNSNGEKFDSKKFSLTTTMETRRGKEINNMLSSTSISRSVSSYDILIVDKPRAFDASKDTTKKPSVEEAIKTRINVKTESEMKAITVKSNPKTTPSVLIVSDPYTTSNKEKKLAIVSTTTSTSLPLEKSSSTVSMTENPSDSQAESPVVGSAISPERLDSTTTAPQFMTISTTEASLSDVNEVQTTTTSSLSTRDPFDLMSLFRANQNLVDALVKLRNQRTTKAPSMNNDTFILISSNMTKRDPELLGSMSLINPTSNSSAAVRRQSLSKNSHMVIPETDHTQTARPESKPSSTTDRLEMVADVTRTLSRSSNTEQYKTSTMPTSDTGNTAKLDEAGETTESVPVIPVIETTTTSEATTTTTQTTSSTTFMPTFKTTKEKMISFPFKKALPPMVERIMNDIRLHNEETGELSSILLFPTTKNTKLVAEHIKSENYPKRKDNGKSLLLAPNFDNVETKISYSTDTGAAKENPAPRTLFTPVHVFYPFTATLPDRGFILHTVSPGTPRTGSNPDRRSHHGLPLPKYSRVETKFRQAAIRRKIDLDKFREFINNIRHGPTVHVPKGGLYTPGKPENDPDVDGAAKLPSAVQRFGSPSTTFSDVGGVFTRYWPAVLGISVGTIFLLMALVTSVVCRQRRLLVQRARWTDSPQHVTEPPDTSEYSSSSEASLTGDLTRSSINLM